MTSCSFENPNIPVVRAVSYFLAHVPNMVRHGSKPSREIERDPSLLKKICSHLNTFDQAVAYPPNQVFIGNLDPDDLHGVPRPWFQNGLPNASRNGLFGEIMPEDEFIGMMKVCDEFNLLLVEEHFLDKVRSKLERHPLIDEEDLKKLQGKGSSPDVIEKAIVENGALPLYQGKDSIVGCCRRGHENDFNLIPEILIENLAGRASGVMALRNLVSRFANAKDFDYLIGCGEEAVGDRYNRGGGNMAKAIGELCGCLNATGSDTKAFCCAPIHAMIVGSGLVRSGIFKHVGVIAGGSFAKLGMKFQGHLRHDMPVLEDVIAGMAVWIGPNDGHSPMIRTDAIGKHDIQSGSSQQEILQNLVTDPLDRLGLKITDVDKFGTEMHNPELTEPQGSGNVPKTNYRVIGSLAVLRKEIEKSDLDEFVKTRGMLGFSPTQGHIASAIPVLGHVVRQIKAGRIKRAFLLAKGSLFLGRMTQLSDGMSFLLEKNPGGTHHGD